ncbi:uncharacterized protein K452DRAFT_254647 [Aplosporella prunicola CBS 121167]|uniref:Pentacotripeptide-repeat region of PRORP domain-containing protein n=1 Tax=Aplosporella prunicola CBS 121167 TaxID=1176127 RepID=A0A6A6B811_9PEZI|nr:uncharacterized protein K452DRAFT_254647 [Aplosporella prunicola CBS 121167]KAF2139344.1 hypothetical protein K452DRAFT_254647 [Aplosporella prunicola CBS 121167]
MLSCRLCLGHSLRAVTQRPPLTSPANALARLATRRPINGQRLAALSPPCRSYATAELAVDALSEADRSYVPYEYSQKAAERKKVLVGNLHRNLKNRELDPDETAFNVKLLKRINNDPLKLADFVNTRLRFDDVSRTIAVVRFASKYMNCVVSWNHVINHIMSLHRVPEAMKIYNDMKKRGQRPDSYTYTIVLRGLGDNAHHDKDVVGNALSVYHSMSAPNSQVEPTTIHTNAVLRACARANNMDALWGVVAKLPESGRGAPDTLTYSTILNAIRYNAMDAPVGLNWEELARRRNDAIIDGRRLWENIVSRWRNGDLMIDEGLTCTMGRLLLLGERPRDWDDVLSLVQQTMDIPRLTPRLGSDEPRGEVDFSQQALPFTPKDFKDADLQPIDPDDKWRPGGEFDPVEREVMGRKRRSKYTVVYARPGHNTFSLILAACLKMAAKKAALDYFKLFTGPEGYKLEPDHDNLHMFLRILRQSRSSAEAVEFVRVMVENKKFVMSKTFRIAMSTCVRDKNNPNIFKHACELMDLMENSLREMDGGTVAMFAGLAAHLKNPRDILYMLNRTTSSAHDLRRLLTFKRPETRRDKEEMKELIPARRNAIDALRHMQACCDQLLLKGAIPADLQGQFMERKIMLTKQLNQAQWIDPDLASYEFKKKYGKLLRKRDDLGYSQKREQRGTRGHGQRREMGRGQEREIKGRRASSRMGRGQGRVQARGRQSGRERRPEGHRGRETNGEERPKENRLW